MTDSVQPCYHSHDVELYIHIILYPKFIYVCSFLRSVTTTPFLSDLRTQMYTFYHEIAILKKVSTGQNPHVINMIGYITQENPPAIVLEYAPFGNLHDFLVKFRDEVRAKQNITTIIVIIYYYIFLCIYVCSLYISKAAVTV